MATAPVVDWLLDGDPAIRWQALRDLTDASPAEVDSERHRVADEGWGARLLALQDPDGSWGGGLYTPKWTSTFYTLFLLTAMGLAPGNAQGRKAAELLLDRGICADGGLRVPGGPRALRQNRHGKLGELCETGMGLRMLASFVGPDLRLRPLVNCLLATQLSDGGWNCQRTSAHGSFHTSISVLEGLREWSRTVGGDAEVDLAAERGREFFLAHRIYRSHRTGAVVAPAMARFTFPYHWHHDVLRGLDYFQSVNAPRDERFQGAIALVRSRCSPDGRWPMQGRHPGKEYFVMEANGEPSRWNTLRCLRVLRWWES